MDTQKISVLKAHMSLTLKLPEVTESIFKEYEIMVNYPKMHKKANDIISSLKGSTVAEATLILQEVLRETYNQLTFENIENTDFSENTIINISETSKASTPVPGYQ